MGSVGVSQPDSLSSAASLHPPLPDSSASAPLEALDARSCFHHYGYGLQRYGSYYDAAAVSRVGHHVLSIPTDAGPPAAIEFINGKVTQMDLLRFPSHVWKDTPAAGSWERILRAAAGKLALDCSGLHLVATKLLIAYGEDGLQALHWDHADGPKANETRVSCLLFLSNEKRSTAMPRFQPHLHFPPGSDPSPEHVPFLSNEWYHSVTVHLGDLLLFQQSVPHYGVANAGVQPRIALFTALSSSVEAGQDDYQLFRWSYIEHAFGSDSREFAEALIRDAHVGEPLLRYNTREELLPIVLLLLQHNCYGRYPWHKLGRRQRQWVRNIKQRWKAKHVQQQPSKKARLCKP